MIGRYDVEPHGVELYAVKPYGIELCGIEEPCGVERRGLELQGM